MQPSYKLVPSATRLYDFIVTIFKIRRERLRAIDASARKEVCL